MLPVWMRQASRRRNAPSSGALSIRPRSAAPPTLNPAWLVAGFVVVALIAFGGWRLLSPISRRSVETAVADSQIVLPGREAFPPANRTRRR